MKNLNPLYEYLNLSSDNNYRLKSDTDLYREVGVPSTFDKTFGMTSEDRASLENQIDRFNEDKDNIFYRKRIKKNDALKDIDTAAKIGSIAGTAGGGIGGGFLASKLLKNKLRKEIKNTILNSDSPEDCIEKLKTLGTPLALKYCDVVNKVSETEPISWKQKIASSINIKNVSGTAIGTIAGSYLGHKLGRDIGMQVGIGNMRDSNDRLINTNEN